MDINEKINLLEHEIEKIAKGLEKQTSDLLKRLEDQKELLKQLSKQSSTHSGSATSEALKEIHESLAYSKRIQQSMLPDPRSLTKVFNDKMLIYRPKDVVSGDFYWFERIRTGRQEHAVIIAADCTGHGVPGAIMSMVSSNQLTNIIYYQNYIEPERILARLDKAIKSELYRGMEPDQQRHDGLEAGVCVIDLDSLQMNFAGVGIPLHMVRDGELTTFKSAKYTIGQMEGNEKEVEQQIPTESLQLEKGDRLYLASDGYKDQFGGKEDKKLMAGRFHELLVKTGENVSMSDQEKNMADTLDHWMGTTTQTDDILLLGWEV